ncbi:hypothetical protein ACIBQ1_47915 [Nonomuraea sp. NPDC050153]|uniref:hypothetical protein n=1 Tax=Nonomuraea sp. NPDC050153 TaxID=3364359 RepID=UPI0037A2D6CB
MKNVSTVWLIIIAGILVLAFVLVMNSGLSGVAQVVLLAVLGIAAVACFALLVVNAVGRPHG